MAAPAAEHGHFLGERSMPHRLRAGGRTELHVDHVVPLAAGGATTGDNLRTACDECNLDKATRAVVPFDLMRP